jgi:glycosyltransferase involved in cell wall biosynthesis
MIIDHFSTFPHGGAGTAARRLHERLVARGVNSRFNFWKDEQNQSLDPSFHQLKFSTEEARLPILGALSRKLEKRRCRRICQLYDRHVAERPENFELFTIPWSLEATRFDRTGLTSDIIHLHWMPFFIDYPRFFHTVPAQTPIVWSFHDMNPMTGGCHYSSGCSRFTVGCGNCPQISHPHPRDVSWLAFRSKQKALRRKMLHVVTPNRWLSDLARHSAIFPESTEFHVIRLGLDEQAFRPLDRRQARRRLGLPEEGSLIAFGAEDIGNYRKGFHHLLAALRKVRRQTEVSCVVFGRGKLPEDRSGLPPFREFGFVDSVERHRLIYAAADLFVLPSREDNQPQTGLEAMACGTPVVGFRAGGIPEYVRHNKTGLIATTGDEDEMSSHIQRLICDRELRDRLSREARRMIELEFTAELQAKRYIELYRDIANRALPIELQASIPQAA